MRTKFIHTLTRLAENDSRIFLVIADLGFSVVEEFQRRFPDRFINAGIAEANAVSLAAGLALSGKIPYVYSIAPFVTMRAYEQVRVDCAYMQTNVRIVGVGGGVAYGPAGATHHAIEDLSIMRTLPNMTVLAPGDPWEAEHLVEQSVAVNGPVYIRLSKNNEPVVSNMQAECRIGRANIYSSGSDLSILTTSNTFEMGTLITQSLSRDFGLSASLANIHTIKPIDEEYVNRLIHSGRPIFTIEEHNQIGGLGSAVSECIAESGVGVHFKRFAIPDEYSHYVGSQDYIRSQWGIDCSSLTDAIASAVKGRSGA
jgi:transketolase